MKALYLKSHGLDQSQLPDVPNDGDATYGDLEIHLEFPTKNQSAQFVTLLRKHFPRVTPKVAGTEVYLHSSALSGKVREQLKVVAQHMGAKVLSGPVHASNQGPVDVSMPAYDPSKKLAAERRAMKRRMVGMRYRMSGNGGSLLPSQQVVGVTLNGRTVFADVERLVRSTQRRKVVRLPIASLKGTKLKGTKEDARLTAAADTKYPILVHGEHVIDGRHRIQKLKDQGETHVQARMLRQSDWDKAQLSRAKVRKIIGREPPRGMDYEEPIKGTLTKRAIAQAVAEEIGVAQVRVAKPVIQATLDKIATALLDGQRIELRNFGVFEMRRVKGRVNVDPRDQSVKGVRGERYVVRFKPSRKIHDQRPGYLSHDGLRTMTLPFPDEQQARQFAAQLLAKNRTAKVSVDGTKVKVRHGDQDTADVHMMMSEHARRQGRLAKRRARRLAKMSLAQKPAQPMVSDPAAKSPAQRTARTQAQSAGSVSMVRLYFEGDDLADEAAAWMQRHGVKVQRRTEHSREMLVQGERRTVNKAVAKFNGNPMGMAFSCAPVAMADAIADWTVNFPNPKKCEQAVYWLRKKAGVNVSSPGNRSRFCVIHGITPVLMKTLFATLEAAYGATNSTTSQYSVKQDPADNPYSRIQAGKDIFIQFVVDFGSKVLQERAMQAMQEKGVLNPHEDQDGLVAAGVKAVAESAIKAIIAQFRGKTLFWKRSKSPFAPPLSPFKKDNVGRAPMNPPAVNVNDLPKVPPRPTTKKQRQKDAKAYKQYGSGPGYSFGLEPYTIAYAVMDFLTQEATRTVADYLLGQGIKAVTKGGTRVVASIKDAAQNAKVKDVVAKMRGRLRWKRKPSSGQSASMALPLAIPIIVYALEGLAAMLTVTKMVKELQASGIETKQVGKKVLARPRGKAQREKMKRIASEEGAKVKPVGGMSMSAAGKAMALTPEEQAAEKVAQLNGHTKARDKYRARADEAKSRGDYNAQVEHTKRARAHQSSIDALNGKSAKSNPSGGGGRSSTPPPGTSQRDWARNETAEAFRKMKRTQTLVTLGVWGMILAPYLIAMGIKCYQKGKEWFAQPKDEAQAEKVKDVVEKQKRKSRKAASMGIGSAIGNAIGKFTLTVGGSAAKTIVEAAKRLGVKIWNMKKEVTVGGAVKTVMVIQGTRQSIKDIKRLAAEKDASFSMEEVRMGAAEGAKVAIRFATAAAAMAALTWLNVRNIQASTIGTVVYINTFTKLIGNDVRACAKKFKGALRFLTGRKKAASMAHAADRIMKRHRRRMDVAMSESSEDMGGGYSYVAKVTAGNTGLVIKLAEEAGLVAERYDSGRMTITGKRSKVEAFVATLRQRLYGEELQLTEDLALAHQIGELIEVTDERSLRGQALRLAYQDLKSLHPIKPGRLQQYRELAMSFEK